MSFADRLIFKRGHYNNYVGENGLTTLRWVGYWFLFGVGHLTLVRATLEKLGSAALFLN